MVIAFQNLFGKGYEGGANWLEVGLYSLGLAPNPPRCLVLGGSRESLPSSLIDAAHVEVVSLDRVAESRSKRIACAVLRRIARQPWEDPAIREVAAKFQVDLWVGFAGFEGLAPDRPLLVWYPDFQFRYFPELFDPQEILDRERQWDYVARRANGIVAISESVAADAIQSHPGVAGKMHVCGFPPVFEESVLTLNPDEVRCKYHLPDDFFIVSNQFWSHKNHMLVLRALSWLRAQGEEPPVVAFTGRPHDYRNPDGFSDLLKYIHSENLHQYCRILGVVPRNEQLALIRSAVALIHPSRFEGRGAIVEEAAVLGTQVLCSDLPVHRELNAPGTIFFPVDGIEELGALLQRNYPRSNRTSAAIAADSHARLLQYGGQLMHICDLVTQTRRGQSAAPAKYALTVSANEQ